jgi:hypothetical protein
MSESTLASSLRATQTPSASGGPIEKKKNNETRGDAPSNQGDFVTLQSRDGKKSSKSQSRVSTCKSVASFVDRV